MTSPSGGVRQSPSLSPSHSPSARPARLPPRPSPSLSPSIVSLLNDASDLQTPFAHADYFAPDPAHPTLPPPPPPAAAPSSSSSSTKRPRPSSSAGYSTTSASNAAVDEEEGAMQPPSTRMRRSSSLSSNPPPPPPPAPAAPPSAPAALAAPSPPVPSARPPPPALPPAPGAPTLPRLEPSIFNVEPIDEFTREVADWLWGFCAPLDWDRVEIEAKVGMLVDTRAGGMRVHLPVPIETILTDDTGLRFQSNMTVNQHKAFNMLLNSRVEEAAQPSYPAARVRYAHTRELDTFHDLPAQPHLGHPRRKIRVTRDQKDKTKVHAVEKVRVADMNVFSPKRKFDWRVSVSLEMPAPVPDTPANHSRHKDRISYSHQLFQVDLTQVTVPPSQNGNQNGQHNPSAQAPTHELEVEFKAARPLLEEAAKEQRGEENRYLEMVQGLLNNVRMLIRNASDP